MSAPIEHYVMEVKVTMFEAWLRASLSGGQAVAVILNGQYLFSNGSQTNRLQANLEDKFAPRKSQAGAIRPYKAGKLAADVFDERKSL
jgi:hypothetical protein